MKSFSILVIEDNEQNLYLTRFLLEKHGFSVTDARSGSEGLAIAGKGCFDLILLDVQLPQMDGYTVAVKLREQASTANVPIVVVTSYAMAGDREKALASGATDYIEKPIDPATFVSRICTHLDGSGSSRAAVLENSPRDDRNVGETGRG